MWIEIVEERDRIKKLKMRKGRRSIGGKKCVNMKQYNICQFVVCLMTLTVS